MQTVIGNTQVYITAVCVQLVCAVAAMNPSASLACEQCCKQWSELMKEGTYIARFKALNDPCQGIAATTWWHSALQHAHTISCARCVSLAALYTRISCLIAGLLSTLRLSFMLDDVMQLTSDAGALSPNGNSGCKAFV